MDHQNTSTTIGSTGQMTDKLRRVISECDDVMMGGLASSTSDVVVDTNDHNNNDNDDEQVVLSIVNDDENNDDNNNNNNINTSFDTINTEVFIEDNNNNYNNNNNEEENYFTSNDGNTNMRRNFISDHMNHNNNKQNDTNDVWVPMDLVQQESDHDIKIITTEIMDDTVGGGGGSTVPMRMIESTNFDGEYNYQDSSSLSCDDSDDVGGEELNILLLHERQREHNHRLQQQQLVAANQGPKPPLQQQQPPPPPVIQQQDKLKRVEGSVLQRMGSYQSSNTTHSSSSQRDRSSSQTSIWGWFEDVHQSGEGGGHGGSGRKILSHNNDRHNTNRHSNNNRGQHHNQHRHETMKTGSAHNTSINHTKGKIKDPTRILLPKDNTMMMMHNDENGASALAVTAPNYVLEESLSSQLLWKESAGQRPPQPLEERAFYEKMWAQNFERSQVDYQVPVEVLTAASPISLNPFADNNFVDDNDVNGGMHMGVGPVDDDNCYVVRTGPTGGETKNGPTDVAEAALVSRMNTQKSSSYHMSNQMGNKSYNCHPRLGGLTVVNKTVKDSVGEGDLVVLVRGDNVFGTTVSKSFIRPSNAKLGLLGGVDTINISIASYRVVTNKKHEKYAQFLVIYREGSIQDTVGIWKRYRDFEELAHKVTQSHEGCAVAFANISPLAVTEETETEHLPNAITSWRLLKKRQRWFRCLDAGYLSLKVFLLERFLHDILFESSSPQLLRDFVCADSHLW